jgi:hypothetical protein
MRAAVSAERQRTLRQLQRLDHRRIVLTHEIEQVDVARAALRESLRLLGRLSSDEETATGPMSVAADATAPDARLFEPREVLRGARIREVAARLLAARDVPSRPIHYLEILNLLSSERFAVAGKDSAASLLTQLRRSPVIRSADAPGTYCLDLRAPERLARQIRELRSQVADLDARVETTADELSRRRVRRERLVSELGKLERALEEALRTLGPS